MSEIKKLIDGLDRVIEDMGLRLYLRNRKGYRKDRHLLTQIKSILEQQYQHEQNILNYGTDEPDEKQPQPDNELISVCCRAKIKIEYVDCGEGRGYPREICAKCRKEIIEVPIQPDEYRVVETECGIGEIRKIKPRQDEGELVEKIAAKVIYFANSFSGLPEWKDVEEKMKTELIEEIRTLLQSSRPSVTREEILDAMELKPYTETSEINPITRMANLFESKGIPVKGE